MNQPNENLKVKRIADIEIPAQFSTICYVTTLLNKKEIETEKLDEIFFEICRLIDNNSINIITVAIVLNNLTAINPKSIHQLSLFYKMLREKYSFQFTPENIEFRIVLNSIGFSFEVYNQRALASDIISIYKKNTSKYYATWDKIDELMEENNKENFNSNQLSELLDIACEYGAEKCFKYLKLLGPKISNKTVDLAIVGGNKNIIMSLYNDGYDFQQNYLWRAIQFYNNDVFDWLLEFQGINYELSIGKCLNIGNIEAFVFLVENGFDVNKRFYYGCDGNMSALGIAIQMKSFEMVQYLVGHGADVNMSIFKNRNTESHLSIAIEMNSFEIVEYLVNHGAIINIELGNGFSTKQWFKTPLSYAIELKSLKIVQFLVQHGADINKKICRKGQDMYPLKLAKIIEYQEIVQYLESLKAIE